MRIAACVAAVVLGAGLLGGSGAVEESSYRAHLTYSELITYGMISAYSTNVLVHNGFAGGCLSKEDALNATTRNLAFVKVLQRYASALKRTSPKETEGMKKMVAEMHEVTTYLEEQTLALKEWVGDRESKSAELLYDRYSKKVEDKITAMLEG